MSRLPNGSASASDRTIRCPTWLALPHVERSSEYSERGTQIHGYVRAVLEGADPTRALEAVDQEHRRLCVLLDWSRLGADLEAPLETEGAYAIDVRARTARYLGSNVGRDYAAAAKAQGAPLAATEVPGSLDLAGLARGNPRRLVVLDLKSGFRDVTPSEDNGQGLFFAAAKLLLHEDIDEVEFRIAHTKTDGRVWDRDRAVFTRLDVDTYLDEYEDALERAHEAKQLVVAGQTPDVAEGEWCRYCPSANSCPAKTRLVRAILPELASLDARVGAMTIDEIGAAWQIAHDRAAPLLERVLDALKERIHRDGSAPIPGGTQVAKSIRYPQDKFVQREAIALLERLGATQDEIARCFHTVEIRKIQNVNAAKVRKGRAA